MIDKICLLKSVHQHFKDGMTVMVGGFGVPGTPFTLIDALIEAGVSDLTLIKNEANEDHMGLSKLIEAVREIITSEGRTLAQGALAWIWGRSERTVPIPGFKTVSQVQENAGATQFGPLTSAQMAEIDQILERG